MLHVHWIIYALLVEINVNETTYINLKNIYILMNTDILHVCIFINKI